MEGSAEHGATPPATSGITAHPQPNDGHGRRRLPRLRHVVMGLGVVLACLVTWVLVSRLSPGFRTSFPVGTYEWEHHVVQRTLVDRHYSVGVPAAADGAHRRPAVIALHAFGGERSVHANMGDLKYKAAQDMGAVLVYPQALWSTWNSGTCCFPSTRAGVDDVSFLDEVIAEVAARPDVDPDRIYLTGESAGGLMALRYTCAGSEDIAATLVVVAVPFNADGCEDRRTPTLVFIGDADEVFPMDGGWTPLAGILAQRPSPEAIPAVRAWAAAAGCEDESDTVDIDTLGLRSNDGVDYTATSRTFSGCDAPVELVVVHGMGHTWPWGGRWGPWEEFVDFVRAP